MSFPEENQLDGDESPLSLQDLAERTGLEQRTIRSYVERGLLPGPESLGRGARYPREALDRLRVMQLLRDANRSLSLDQIRVLLQRLSAGQVRAIASGAMRIAGVIDTEVAQSVGRSDALAYLQSLKASEPGGVTQEMSHVAAVPRREEDTVDPNQLSALAQAARVLAGLAGTGAAPRTVRSEAWHRIPITPDIELSVRGAYGTEEMAQWHRIGDALRQLLTKGVAR